MAILTDIFTLFLSKTVIISEDSETEMLILNSVENNFYQE